VIGTVIIPMPVFLPPIFPVPLVIPVSALIPIPVVVLPWAIVSRILRIVMISIIPVVSKSILGNGKRQPEDDQRHHGQFFSHMIPPIPKIYVNNI
jgi:ABC-type nitrate/sulfonate/bicarbonate transport system permease component